MAWERSGLSVPGTAAGDIKVIRAVLTEERGTLFTVYINGDSMEFGLYSDGAVTQDMVYGHPPIRMQHMDRLCSRVENDLQGRLRYQDDPAIERAWQACLDAKFEKAGRLARKRRCQAALNGGKACNGTILCEGYDEHMPRRT